MIIIMIQIVKEYNKILIVMNNLIKGYFNYKMIEF